MKYDILVQTEKKEVFYTLKFVWIILLVRKQYLPKKNPALLAQKMSKSVSGYSKTKKMDH